ncbi:hypothetical protein FE783_20385 [Paenibacillus mesophilus]|uniref:hypothetical protein n=1 Tax=Paenibacillus mesophilus TaxID=2582849 RepID=UPI00110F23C8|nr:hypothetical protein [Paenibacillus mesophilus]TMV47795.1 hypothetical protein FE783_20385 [Paenibacillus mesophilus]
MNVMRIFRSQLLSLLMLTVGLTLLVGISKATNVQASGSGCTPPVTASVYISVYGIGDNPGSVTCVAGSSVVISSVYAKYDITLHVSGNEGKPAIIVQGGKVNISSADVSSGTVTFSNVEYLNGSELRFALVPDREWRGMFYKRSDEILFQEGDYGDLEFAVPSASQFDFYVYRSGFDDIKLVGPDKTVLGSSAIVEQRAFVPNVPIAAGSRIYALLSDGGKIEEVNMVGVKPLADPETFKVISNAGTLQYRTNNASIMQAFPSDFSNVYVLDQPADNVLVYYGDSLNYPLVNVTNGVDERIVTVYDYYNTTVIDPELYYTLTLKAVDGTPILTNRLLYAFEPPEMEGPPLTPLTTHMSDSLGRVTFLGGMQTNVFAIPFDLEWNPGEPLPSDLVWTGDVFFPNPGVHNQAELPVLPLFRPGAGGTGSSVFGLQDLVWIATHGHVMRDAELFPEELKFFLELLVP